LLEARRVDDAVVLAEKIINVIRKLFAIDGHIINLSTSIDISMHPHGCQDIDYTLKNSNMVIYFFKSHSRNGRQFFVNINQ
jgi:GGDEF domain-containing protein